ncbi:unnamed protein product [Parascedosporium putredinis]|uniref:Uncharacterized protein n=1 Tax=Parascedosporium putredinis TaxID=1442378 RepID=A0A9P1H541_9PEZI|nr:unnamed protein product [Parascedosporium putredinis]CAI7996525.1 unnamed protein product [Parascedosporium putredinis]
MAGLLVDVYGLEELSTPVRATQVTCLWLHHPRLQTRAIMGAFGRRAVDAWNEKRRSARPDSTAASRGLVALAFDQRNHGSRLVDELANESWKKGNETHALDMMGAPEDDGTSFLGSRHFPRDLVEVCRSADPKGLVFGTTGCDAAPQEPRQEEIAQFFDRTIKGKKFLACSGGADKLVPHSVSEPFMKFFQAAVKGWYKDGGVSVEDRVYEGIGHSFSEGMVRMLWSF